MGGEYKLADDGVLEREGRLKPGERFPPLEPGFVRYFAQDGGEIVFTDRQEQFVASDVDT